MIDVFKNILVPVNFSISSDTAIIKAIELSGKETIIHLLHVYESTPFRIHTDSRRKLFGKEVQFNGLTPEEMIQNYKQIIADRWKGVSLTTSVIYQSSVQSGIVMKSRHVDADIVIIGKSSSHSLFPFLNTITPVEITDKTGTPVLTVKPGAINQITKKIIVPISGGDSEIKLHLLKVIANKLKISVSLVTFMQENRPQDFQAASLMHAYKQITEQLHLPVEYSVLHGHNKAKQILKFAKTIDADMLLVHAHTETKIGWLNKQISDVLVPESKIQVLAVQPAN
jgi:nucleotide-binding universal stress UspA family protein